MPDVKRPYDSTGRRARAQRNRDAVVTAAREMFLDRGFAATTVAEVAAGSGLSAEFVYKQFGGKAGLIRAVVARALEGSGPQPAERRSDALPVDDARALVRGWGRLSAEVAPLVAPLLLLVRSAAAQDRDVAELADELDAARHDRMASNAQRLADAGHLREGLDVGRAADVLWTFSAPELYDLLVVRRGWDPDSYGDFVTRGIAAELLEGRD